MILNMDPSVGYIAPPWYTDGLSVAGFGDSIMAGHDGFTAQLEGGPSGDVESQSLYQLKALYPSAFTFQNYGIGSSFLAGDSGWGAAAVLDTVIASLPKAAIAHVGVNDVSIAETWANMATALDSIKSRFASGSPRTHLFIDAIFPNSNFDDTAAALVRTRNGQIQTWCAGNGATFIDSHDAMGQIRVSTGEYDDLKTAYGGGLHPNVAGYTEAAALYKTPLDAYYS